MAAVAIRIGRRVRAQGQDGPASRGSVVGYCMVLATQRAVATSRVRAMSRSAPSLSRTPGLGRSHR